MNKIFFLLTAIFFQFSTIQMYAQNKGNDCESAIVCEINGTPVAGVMIPPDSWWYTFTLYADYTDVEISTCNSTINMSDVYLYEDCLETSIANGDWCNQAGGNYNEKIELANLTAGTYYVEVVGDFGYPSGAYTLSITGVTSALNNDIGITHISKPVKKFNNAMPVTVTIENFGINSQTGFPVSYTFMENTITETYTGTISPGESAQYTFLQTIDLATENTYSITAKTELVGDENPVNDEFSTQINTYVNPNALFFIYDDYAVVPDNPAFDFTDDFTIEAWFYPHSTKMVGKLISKHGNDGTNRSGYALEYDGSNIKAVIGIGPNWMVVSEAAPPDQWHHVAMVYNSGTFKMYLNGIVAQSSAYATILSNDLDLYIGASQQYGDNWTGYIDELRIWNDARTEAEIQENMNTEINPQSENLLAYYDFNRGIPEGDNTAIETLPDMTDNNFHADMYNFALQAGLADGNFFEDCNLDIAKPETNQAVLESLLGECSLIVSTTPTATDACAGTIAATTSDPLEYSEQGTYTITWTYDDGNGNIATQEQTVIVDDITDPVPDATTLNDLSGECSVTVSVTPTATDNCAGTIAATTSDPLEYSEQGTYTITWTYDDGNGNTVTQEQTVIVDDITDPVPDATTLNDLSGECSVTVSATPTATDNCAGTIAATTSDPLEYSEQGTYTITWTYDDGNGNTVTQEQTVIVDDITDPSITCVDNQSINLNEGESFYTVQADEFDPTETTDNCGIAEVLNDFNSSSSLENEELTAGTYTITWTVTDNAGNSAECSFEVEVNDFVGVSDIELNGISIYPNPTTGIVTIDFPSSVGQGNVKNFEITDISGRTIFRKDPAYKVSTKTIDLTAQPAGIYFLKIITEKGIYIEKIIKQ